VLSLTQKKRAIYDNNTKATDVHQNNIPFNTPQNRDPEAEKRINQAILFIFYLARKRDAMKPGIGIVELEKLATLPEKELDFHIWYLKEKRLDSETRNGRVCDNSKWCRRSYGKKSNIGKNIIFCRLVMNSLKNRGI